MKQLINQCNGKEKYITRKHASDAAVQLNKKGGKRLTVYECQCGYFHLGHQNRKFLPAKKVKNPAHIKYDHESRTHKLEEKFIKRIK